MATYVIVNQDNEIYEEIDPIQGTFSRKKFRLKKNATAELASLIDEGMLDESKSWTVDDYSKVKDRIQQKALESRKSKGHVVDLSEYFGEIQSEEADEIESKLKFISAFQSGDYGSGTWNF